MNISHQIKLIVLFFTLPLLLLLFHMVFNISLQDGYHHINGYYFLIVLGISLVSCSYLAITCYPSYPLKERLLFLFLILTALISPFGDYVLIPIIGCVIFIFTNPISRKNILTKFDILDYCWLIFTGYCLIHSFSIPTYDKASAIGISLAFLAYGFLFKIARYTILPPKIKKDLSFLFCAVLMISISFGIYHLFHKSHITLLSPLNISLLSQGFPGLASIFSRWPANTAGFLVMSASIVFYLLFFTQNASSQKVYLTCSLLVIFSGVLATETRMALLFIAGFLGLFLVLYPFQQFKKIRFIILLMPIALLPILISYSDKWKETLSNPFQQATILDRLTQYQYGLSMWNADNHLFGIGLMNFRYFYNSSGLSSLRVDFLHNIYLSFLTETGVIGLILFLLNIFVLFKMFWNQLPKIPAYFGIYFLGGLMCVGLVDSWFFVLRFSVLLFIILGFTLGQSERS